MRTCGGCAFPAAGIVCVDPAAPETFVSRSR
jgi:hypothetical protein